MKTRIESLSTENEDLLKQERTKLEAEKTKNTKLAAEMLALKGKRFEKKIVTSFQNSNFSERVESSMKEKENIQTENTLFKSKIEVLKGKIFIRLTV